VRIAKALYVSVDQLLGFQPEAEPAVVFWRDGRSPEREAQLLERARRYAFLERISGLAKQHPDLPQYQLEADRLRWDWAKCVATEVGRSLNLGSRPAASLGRVLESKFDVKIFHEHLGEDGSAACSRGEFGYAVLLNADEAPWRRNYSLAHELFHMITWEATRGLAEAAGSTRKRVKAEKLANAFASYLLLPDEEVRAQIEQRFQGGETDYSDLVEMAADFDVSTSALVWRLRLLDRISQQRARAILEDPEFSELDRRSKALRWEGRDDPPVLPRRYVLLAFHAYQRSEISQGKLAELLEVPLPELYHYLPRE
jgi:Zn-dependent peptidase ImmA (M78 family)